VAPPRGLRDGQPVAGPAPESRTAGAAGPWAAGPTRR
jgi:hypothetical protein